MQSLVIDRLAEGANSSRAAVVHARTLEVLEPLDLASILVACGLEAQQFTIRDRDRDRDRVLVPIAFDRLPTKYPYTLMISQAVTEHILRARLSGSMPLDEVILYFCKRAVKSS